MRLLPPCVAAIAFGLLGLAVGSGAQAASASPSVMEVRKFAFNIVSQSLARALTELAQQADLTIFVDDDVVVGVTSPEVRGLYTIVEALGQLLAHSGLRFKAVGATTIVVMPQQPGDSKGGAHDSAPASTDGSVKHSPHPKSTKPAASRSPYDRESDLEKVIVTGNTGTRLKDPKAADSSAQRVYDQEDLERSGAATVSEFAETMPENFNSISSVSSLYGNTVGLPQLGNNPFVGSGFNLHGLGPEATLTLIDGDRLVSGGASGAFLDLSLLPMNAVARIVTMTGDTSAVYGSDAIAGVVNILLKSGIDRGETRIRYGTTSGGGGGQWTFSQLLGRKWQDGGAMVAYQLTQQNPVLSSARRYIPPVDPEVDIVPRQKSSGLLSTLEHRFGEDTSVKVHLLYGSREVVGDSSGFSGYRLKRASQAEEYGGTVHVDSRLTTDWTVGLYGSYSKLRQSLLTLAPGVPSQTQPGNNSLGEFALSADGESLTVFGRTVTVAFGVGGRKETLTVPTSLYRTRYSSLARKVGDMYGETLLPLAGPHTLLERLELSLVVREDYYEAVGPTLNPKAGLLWSPAPELNVRATYARSFRPPTLDELAAIPFYYTLNLPDRASAMGVTDTLINQSQGISRLKSETARTLTGGLDYRRDRQDGWAASLTWFRTVFDNRVATPLVGSPSRTSSIFAQPQLAPYINRSVDPARIQSIFADPAFVGDFAQAGEIGVMAIFDDELTNVARTLEEGLEGSVRYFRGDTPRQFGAFVIANYLLRDTYRSTPGAPIMSLVNSVGQPNDLRVRGGLTWSMHDWRNTLNVNYTNGYRDALVSPTRRVDSWTTIDLQLAYKLPVSTSLLNPVQLTFSAVNVLNTVPPSVPVTGGMSVRSVGFDASNASPCGRVLSLEVSVGW